MSLSSGQVLIYPHSDFTKNAYSFGIPYIGCNECSGFISNPNLSPLVGITLAPFTEITSYNVPHTRSKTLTNDDANFLTLHDIDMPTEFLKISVIRPPGPGDQGYTTPNSQPGVVSNNKMLWIVGGILLLLLIITIIAFSF